jgi:hypothetical protein
MSCILRKPKVHYNIYNNTTPLPVLKIRLTSQQSSHQSHFEAFKNVLWHGKFLRWVLNTSSNVQAAELTVVRRPQLFIQDIHTYPKYWSPFSHPHTEDAPCRGDRDPLITATQIRIAVTKVVLYFSKSRNWCRSLHTQGIMSACAVG